LSVKDRIAADPVCGMKVDKQNPRGTFEYEGGTYYFCSPGCVRSLEKDPQKYLPYDRLPSVTANAMTTDLSAGRREAGPLF
jgi:YHS domain-containing protein